jgi:hypothetical protein
VVGFDSIIPPGREGRVKESVHLANYHGGEYIKSATIISNAQNQPSMQVSIRWVIKSFLSAAPSYLQCVKINNGKFETTVVFTTEMAGFKVTDASFLANGSEKPLDNGSARQNEASVNVTYAFEKDSLRKDGFHEFTYKVSVATPAEEKQSGDFIFKTNHADAREVKVTGSIEPAL